MKDNLAFARDAQLISQKSYDQMVNSHEMYAPLYRVVEGSNRAGLGTTGGMEPKDAVKARTNVESGYDILDPIQTAYNNSALIVAMSERNGVMRKLAKDAKGTAAQGLFEEVTTPKKSKEELLKSIKDKGLPVEYFKDLPAEVIEVLTENPIVKGENTVNVFEDGVKKSYAVDPAIYEAIKGLGTAREGGILMKLMSYPAQGLRFGATITPAYMAKAFIRDIPHALTTSQYGLTLPDIVRGTFSAFKKDAWYEEFVRSGGAYSSASSLTRDAWSKNIDQMRKAKDRGFFKRAVKDNWLGLKKIQEWNHAFENAPRVAEFRKGIEKGATRQEAAHAARNITLDFQKKGAIAEVVNSIVPFSNAFIQGNAQFVKYMKPKTDANGNYTFKDTAVPYLRAIGYFGVPALINSMLNADNERVRNQAQWEQDSFYNVDMAPFYDDKKNAPIIKIPKTQEFGVFLGNAIEAAVYAIHDKDPKGFKTFAEETLAGYTTSRLFIPTAVAPALEAWANKMFFFNTPVVPYGREGLLPAEQFNERGTQVFVDLSRGLAKIFGDENTFRPAVVENYVNRWSGALGTSLIDGIDKAYKIIGGTDEFKAEDLNYFLKSFYTDYPTMSAKPIREFFDNYKSTEQVHKTIQKLVKEGRQDEAVKLNQKYNKVRQTPTYKAVTRMMHFMKEVKALDMDSARKKELIHQTMLQLIQVAEQANKIMDF